MERFLQKLNNRIRRSLDGKFQEFQKDLLVRNLKSCGTNCMFQMPMVISGAEHVEIGNDVSVAAFVHMWGYGEIRIGNKVMIASHTAISSLTHDYKVKEMRTTLVTDPVVISDNVWIGAHSVIMPGVSIGEGAVVGAGSIVTKDVEPYSIVFGSPAKLHKHRQIDV